jgi:hypothetical protein
MGMLCEIGQPDPLLRQAVEHWCVDFTPKGTNVAATQIIGHNDQEVWSSQTICCHSNVVC